MHGLRTRMAMFVTVALVAACASAPREPGKPAGDFAWTIGTWQGYRIDAASGRRAPMTVHVREMLGGSGIFEELEIRGDNSVYRGASMDVFDPKLSRWVRQYINAGNRRFVRLEGEVDASDATRSTWSVVGSSRRSRLTWRRVGVSGWVRTMHVAASDGAEWRELWRDELSSS